MLLALLGRLVAVEALSTWLTPQEMSRSSIPQKVRPHCAGRTVSPTGKQVIKIDRTTSWRILWFVPTRKVSHSLPAELHQIYPTNGISPFSFLGFLFRGLRKTAQSQHPEGPNPRALATHHVPRAPARARASERRRRSGPSRRPSRRCRRTPRSSRSSRRASRGEEDDESGRFFRRDCSAGCNQMGMGQNETTRNF